MKPVNINGFTIVETMLFLGISGLLIMGILVGTGASINIQRYRDSVTSLQAFLQQQYSNVANISNDSLNNTCSGNSATRGQSDCVILGEYITTDDKTVTVETVLGTTCQTFPSPDDLTALQDCGIEYTTLLANTETYQIDWGSSAVKTDGSPSALSMLILRSPSSGVIRTFISSSSIVVPVKHISDILTETPSALSNEGTICVDSNGLFTGAKLAVRIDSNATSASGIELLGENNGCS